MDPVKNNHSNFSKNSFSSNNNGEISNGVKKIRYLSLKPLIFFGVVLLFLHFIAIVLVSPYYKIWWADIALHTSGGFLVGSFALWYIFNSNKSPISFSLAKPNLASKIVLIIIIVSFAALTGVFWEIFEFIIDKITGYKNYSLKVAMQNYEDTVSDLIFDLVGALLSGIFLKFKKGG